jgi:sorbitol/mannitol transport system substrate-binding protein
MDTTTGAAPPTHRWRLPFVCLVAFAVVAAACGTDSAPEPLRQRAERPPEASTVTDTRGNTGTTSPATSDGPTGTTAVDRPPPGPTEAPPTTEAPEPSALEPAPTTLTVGILLNQNASDACELAVDHFTPTSGIEVDCRTLDFIELAEAMLNGGASAGGQLDVVMVGMYETPQLASDGHLVDLSTYADNDAQYDVDDVFPAVRGGLSFDGGLYASPFYAESSILMYRSDVLDDAGVQMPAAPTWEEVADIARTVHTDDMAGICMRGRAGWGDLGASFTTVLNTFGATWWEANDDGSIGASAVDQPEFAEALNFYVDLLNDAGPPNAAQNSFNDCLELYRNGEVAMWYDATVAPGFLDSNGGDMRTRTGYALAPVQVTDASGWLWAWSLAIPTGATDPDSSWEYIAWATGRDYIELAGSELASGWLTAPPATRASTYEIPGYLDELEFAAVVRDAMVAAPFESPGTTPRPGHGGVQYVGVPEFQSMAGFCTDEFSQVIEGTRSVDEALAACHENASEASS